MMKLKIKTITPGIKRSVYDLNVPKNHNFFILERGILTHNCDYLSSTVQSALRSFIEEYSKNCGFIFTCNYKNRIIDPLRSRFTEIDFTINKEERPKVAAVFFKRILAILKNEEIEFDKAVLAKLVEKWFPDFRRTLNELQGYAASGRIDEGILSNFRQESVDLVYELLKNKKFTEMRKWCSDNADQDTNELFRQLYDAASSKIELKSMPAFVTELAKYMYQNSFVADPEINMCAFLTTIMLECSFQ